MDVSVSERVVSSLSDVDSWVREVLDWSSMGFPSFTLIVVVRTFGVEVSIFS